MPFKSKSQRRKFYAMESRGEISMAKVKEWERETGGKKLPERLKGSGIVTPEKAGSYSNTGSYGDVTGFMKGRE